MIKIVIAAHGGLGNEYLNTLGMITGRKDNMEAVSIDADTPFSTIQNNIKNSLDPKAGTIVLTDMFGGTPSNISLPFLAEDAVEIVFGLNLPMLITAVGKRETLNISQLAAHVSKAGRDSIFRAFDILGKK